MKIFLKELMIKPINTLFICLGLTISIYCLSIGTSVFNGTFNFYNDKNYLYDNNIVCQFDFDKEISIEDFINNIEKMDYKEGFLTSKFVLEKENGKRVNNLVGDYNYKILDKVYNLEYGRYFTEEESVSSEKIALVGSEIYDLVYIKNNKEYIEIENEEYEVIGKIGRKTSSYWGTYIIVPAKALPEQIYKDKDNKVISYYQDSMINKNGYFQEIKNVFKDITLENINLQKIEKESVANKVIDTHKSMYTSLILSIILSLISIFIFSTFWAEGLKRNISIKKVLGADNLYVLKQVLIQLSILVVISSMLASVLNIMTLNYLYKIFNINVTFNFINMLSISLAAFMLVIINSLWIYKDLFKFNILKYIKSE